MKQQKVELIPVVEISISNPKVELPEHGPHWEYCEEWENYNNTCNEILGFSKQLQSYKKGSSLYEISTISNKDVLTLIQLEIQRQQTDEEKGFEDLTCPLDGGYILKVDGQDILYPQCCSHLADIEEWENLVGDDNEDHFYSGHPSPKIIQSDSHVIFDFVNTEIQEAFSPPISFKEIQVNKSSLRMAVETAKKELQRFSNRLETVTQENKLGIEKIAEILVYGEGQ